MTREDRLAVVQRYFDAVNGGDLDAAVALLSPSFKQHTAGMPPGPQAARWTLQMFRGGFPDFAIHVDWLLVDEDRVVARTRATGTHSGAFLGHAATNKAFASTGLDVFRIDDAGLIAERWTEFDTFGMLQQLGIAPMPGRRPS
jgi:steroid delta-isomerase-like uncharacterized protein